MAEEEAEAVADIKAEEAEEDAEDDEDEEAEEMGNVKCVHCEREIPDGSSFCAYCGNKISKSTAEHAKESAREKKGLKKEKLIILAVVAVLLAFLFCWGSRASKIADAKAIRFAEHDGKAFGEVVDGALEHERWCCEKGESIGMHQITAEGFCPDLMYTLGFVLLQYYHEDGENYRCGVVAVLVDGKTYEDIELIEEYLEFINSEKILIISKQPKCPYRRGNLEEKGASLPAKLLYT